MRTFVGFGCWPGQAEGRVVWFTPDNREWKRTTADDRGAEAMRFRAEVGRALDELEAWSEQQQTVEGRMLLQAYREAALEDAWTQRVCAVIDAEGVAAAPAAVEMAEQIQAVMKRSADLQERGNHLIAVARWIADRLLPPKLPPDAILASNNLPPLFVLDRRHPALVAGPEPPVVGGGPMVWGLRELGSHWHGTRVAIDGNRVTFGVIDPIWWDLKGDTLGGLPICYLNGDLEAIQRMVRALNTRPAAMVRRLDDLAAISVFAEQVAAVALDLDKLGPAPRLRHPGVEILLRAAATAAQKAGIPLLAGGEPAVKNPDFWFSLGFTALYGQARSRGGHRTDALRGCKESSL